MKITTNDAIYISRLDLLYLIEMKYPTPQKITSKICDAIILGHSASSDFIKFTEQDEIEFFSQMDWILVYEQLVGMSINDINRISDEIEEEQKKLTNKKTSEIDRYDILNLKMKQLRDALLFRQGSLKIALPKELKISYKEPKKSFLKRFLGKNS